MNENIDLTKILKKCPEGTKFWSPLYDIVQFCCIDTSMSRILILLKNNILEAINSDATITINGIKSPTMMLYPSNEQRDWSKFTAYWYKKERFDPKTLKPFDKVLCWNGNDCVWECDFFSYYKKDRLHPCVCVNGSYIGVIPYNDKTQKFAGTSKIVPEYYRYWED